MTMNFASVFVVGFAAMAVFYWRSTKANQHKTPIKYYFLNFPLFITFSMGLCLHNAIAVLEGYLGIKSPFIRTPKFNVITKKDSWAGNVYLKRNVDFLTIVEGLLSLYFMFGISFGVYVRDFGLIPFHLMLAVGFAGVFIYSVKPVAHE
jgi:hypothetical protein